MRASRQLWQALLLLLFSQQIAASHVSAGAFRSSHPQKRDYTSNSYFVLELTDPSASPYEAASALDLDVVEQVGELEGHWLLSARGGSQLHDLTMARLERLRHKRAAEVSQVYSLEPQHPRKRVKRVWTPEIEAGRLERRQKQASGGGLSAYIQDIVRRFSIQDPIFPEQWHLANDRMQEHTINVTGVWDQGISGKGVHVAVVDDGLDSTNLFCTSFCKRNSRSLVQCIATT